MEAFNILLLVAGSAIGAAISFGALRVSKHYKEKLEQKEKEILDAAREQAAKLITETRARTEEIKETAKEETTNMEQQLEMLKKALDFKGSILDKREQRNEAIKSSLNETNREIRKLEEDIEGAEQEMVEKLKEKTKLNADEAKKMILAKFDAEMELQRGKLLKKTEEDLAEDIISTSKNILRGVIQKITSPSSVDKNSTAVKIKNDKFKGVLVGKGGKNIEYFESMLENISIIFNLEPNSIYVGGLNLVNRNIAKLAIEELQKERGAFGEHQIKRALDYARSEIDKKILKAGREAIKIANINMDIPEDLVRLVGRLKFRTSFGQNILQHSIEMAAMAALMAAEINADIEKAKVATFFHDIGKAIDHEVGGSHDILTKEILEKYNFDPDIVHAAYAHHDGEPQRTAEAMLVKAADAISAGRPGARQESLTSYLERIQKLEKVTRGFEGVKKSYAISAGREVRIIVDEDKLTDEAMKELAQKAAKQIEEELTYPGKIKVNVIRRTEAIDYAR
ncbi:hypothetical protein COW94_00985 [Candidatus Peregrinibacteria bacterium CG22_combo_CG10-13_8_21_14_all_44_10]|nr:MAG: hypothetical protein AUK45_02655 [Candidatus Peregrinibacteria bacterium CG2_30_44_17]PIP66597.1 MAG: hypothetical protein COW94_00985 [Candidatus Peregrinibacteria bacterium CG22_combo_CG10-13_8_21_14_all_44_10]PIX80516.1 MAG: hypothetical protein COZ35_00430 [Candidatus Peregrinibacteria bacterium CG_4_10_14_3_um_filter_44_21]PJB89305.1 MAG: hypothetical protein CO082_01445 [Candidatus Peregrinibacteria bacterium CG_4_9_14_0_8_um_filter_44_15]